MQLGPKMALMEKLCQRAVHFPILLD